MYPWEGGTPYPVPPYRHAKLMGERNPPSARGLVVGSDAIIGNPRCTCIVTVADQGGSLSSNVASDFPGCLFENMIQLASRLKAPSAWFDAPSVPGMTQVWPCRIHGFENALWARHNFTAILTVAKSQSLCKLEISRAFVKRISRVSVKFWLVRVCTFQYRHYSLTQLVQKFGFAYNWRMVIVNAEFGSKPIHKFGPGQFVHTKPYPKWWIQCTAAKDVDKERTKKFIKQIPDEKN